MAKEIEAKTILNKTKKRDPWFLDDYTVNPYGGCSMNCLYCYVRGSKYGPHFGAGMVVKKNAVELLEKQLKPKAKKGAFGIIVLSSATDPYCTLEEELMVTRQLLEVIAHYRFPVHIITKSPLVLRDADLLEKIDQQAILPEDLRNSLSNGAIITFSFSTFSNSLGKIIEPGAPSPTLRLQTLKALCEKGFLAGAALMPLLPYVSDTGDLLENYIQTFKQIKARYVLPASLTLHGNAPYHSKPLIMNIIKKHYPHLLTKYDKFFGASDCMPLYYTEALRKKMTELGNLYNQKMKILNEQPMYGD